jgi:hypothetical protein
VIIREHVFNNTSASDKCTVPGCGVAYAEREQRACMPREVPRAIPVSIMNSTDIGDRAKAIALAEGRTPSWIVEKKDEK